MFGQRLRLASKARTLSISQQSHLSHINFHRRPRKGLKKALRVWEPERQVLKGRYLGDSSFENFGVKVVPRQKNQYIAGMS